MEAPHAKLTPQLLQEMFLLRRKPAAEKVAAVLEGRSYELCLRTRYPKEISNFVMSCLNERGQIESGAGLRCLFIKDKSAWENACREGTNQILIALPELGFDSARSEFIELARAQRHAVIYALTNPRSDFPEIAELGLAPTHEFKELLAKHGFNPIEAEKLAQRANGNAYLLAQLLTGTSERRAWANQEAGFKLRGLALIGGWEDNSTEDQAAISKLVGEPYELWVQRLYPLTKSEEPPVTLTGKSFRPVSRYETWQQLAPYLADRDLERFHEVAVEVLSQHAPDVDLPKEERKTAAFREQAPRYSAALRNGVAESLALLSGKPQPLGCSPALPVRIAEQVVHDILNNADWRRWGSLGSNLSLLAEAAPDQFLKGVEAGLRNLNDGPFKKLFDENDNEDRLFGRSYHYGLLWALEVLAWNPDCLNRVSICLTRLAQYSLPQNMGNNPAATLRGIFLPWLPQTMASIERRKVAVAKVIEEHAETGWRLLLQILPESHQIGHSSQKPVWQDWISADYREGVTRAELHKQVQIYADMAVDLSKNDFGKLEELIARWDDLPREIFQKAIEHLKSSEVRSAPDADRFKLWQKLTDEVQRHRKFRDADWAMPEDELLVLEGVANAIRPTQPDVVSQRLFNHHDIEYYETDNYQEEESKIAAKRQAAVADIIQNGGIGKVIEMAPKVKLPVELGHATGRLNADELDSSILPGLLESPDTALHDFARGYVWSRYHVSGLAWVDRLDFKTWSVAQIAAVFTCMPFQAPVWRRANDQLAEQRSEYWNRLWINPYQAGEDLPEAINLSLANGRPDIALQGLDAQLHQKKPIDQALGIRTIKELITAGKSVRRIDQHDLLQVIGYLQEAEGIDVEAMRWIEFQLLPLLNRFSSVHPVFLERQLATDPKFFHEIIKICFRSEQDVDKARETDEAKLKHVSHVYQLIHNWQTPPGIADKTTINAQALSNWISQAKALCEASGHWIIAQQTFGHTFAHPPAGMEGMLRQSAVAKILDREDLEEARRGLRIELFNRRGVFSYTGGKGETELANQYREYAAKFDLQGFSRIATTLREMAEGYERDAKREAARDPSAGF